MLNVTLLVAAIASAPDRFLHGSWRDGNGGHCVVSWLCSFFHTLNPQAPSHGNEGSEIQTCVAKHYRIPNNRIEELVTLNDSCTTDGSRRSSVLGELSALIEHKQTKQALRAESATAQQLQLVASAGSTSAPPAVDVLDQALSVVAAAQKVPAQSQGEGLRELVGTS